MDKPLISIIVPCYNQAQYLSDALDSVLAQTYSNWECVIVNDGSPDNTNEIAMVYCEKDSRFKYLKQDNQGVSMARNNGVKMSHGEYILPLDGDDMIAPTYCEKAISHFLKFPETKLVYCYAETFGLEVSQVIPSSFSYDEFIWSNQIFNYAIYKRSDFDKTNGYNPNMIYGLDDWDFYLSLLSKDDIVYCIEEVLYYYRKVDNSRSNNLPEYRKETLIQLCGNHPDVYKPFWPSLLYEKEQKKSYQKQCESLAGELVRIRKSYAYRIGKILMMPISYLRRCFS